MRSVKPPFDLGARGRELWAACLKQDDSLGESANPQRFVLHEACRTADILDALNEENPADDALLKHRSLFARLIASLRMPDEATSKRPQRRGPRVQVANKPGGRKPATVSSLDRARRAAGGA